jgi:hypothetical protein
VGMFYLNGNSNGCLFLVSRIGTYGLFLVRAGTSTELTSGTNTVINTGLDQSNLLTAVVRNGKIYIFVNKQPIAHVSDSTYSSGQVALYGEGTTSSIV